MKTYSLAEVAAVVLPPEWDGVDWLTRRLSRGEIRGYRLNHRVWRMTEAHIDELIAHFENVARPAVDTKSWQVGNPAGLAAPITDGLSPRARRRLGTAS